MDDTQTGRESVFTEKLMAFLSPQQNEFLEDEVLRRKRAGVTSAVEAAHGGNPNVNKSTLIREALESHFSITT